MVIIGDFGFVDFGTEGWHHAVPDPFPVSNKHEKIFQTVKP